MRRALGEWRLGVNPYYCSAATLFFFFFFIRQLRFEQLNVRDSKEASKFREKINIKIVKKRCQGLN